MTKLIKLVSSQNEIFVVPQAIIKCSGIISLFCEDDDNDELEEEPLPLPNVSSYILEKVLTWAMYHYEVKETTDWDADFLNMDTCTLIALVAAADYLDIPDLWGLGCKAVANLTMDNSNDSAESSRQI
ncbi:skp1-related protein-like [Drosophila kikkawai]|uniref:Skp1-related protein-like n=2 Tax=Drosophila kikkawai TaxID=30033 RepID=A0A6P4HN47_DROKI|nr:skp1-related protein-like isoform X1 [Drosophila kikkawai]